MYVYVYIYIYIHTYTYEFLGLRRRHRRNNSVDGGAIASDARRKRLHTSLQMFLKARTNIMSYVLAKIIRYYFFEEDDNQLCARQKTLTTIILYMGDLLRAVLQADNQGIGCFAFHAECHGLQTRRAPRAVRESARAPRSSASRPLHARLAAGTWLLGPATRGPPPSAGVGVVQTHPAGLKAPGSGAPDRGPSCQWRLGEWRPPS